MAMRGMYRRIKGAPFVSAILAAVNVVVFFLVELGMSRLYSRGILRASDVLYRGEYGRILWAMFLHSGIDHLFNNMLLVLFMGAMLEREIGHISFALVYFLSGIVGNTVSVWFRFRMGDMAGSLGASGAVFGMDGLLLALVLFSRRRMQSVTPVRVILMIVLSLYSGFSSANVDNTAHVGGLVTGFLLGLIWCAIDRLRAADQ